MADELIFLGSEYCCVLFVDMVDSTTTAFLNAGSSKIRSLYGIFINTLTDVAERFNAKKVKNTGDGVIWYFPKTAKSTNELSFKEVLKCGLGMMESRYEINAKLEKEGMSEVSYRICADYGKHEVVIDRHSHAKDFFSPTMNMCAKMKSHPNTFLIGSDLYENVKSIPEFYFKYAGECKIDPKRGYPTYSVLQREHDITIEPDAFAVQEIKD